MCLIIVTREPTKVSEEILDSALLRNQDGIGAMWYGEDGKLVVRKWLVVKKFDEWFQEYLETARLAEAAGSEYAIHLRMATHGVVSEEMCHPYPLETPEGTSQMMHNGVLSEYGLSKEHSDSWHFARALEKVFRENPEYAPGALYDEEYMQQIGNSAGASNKLVFAYPEHPEKCFSIANKAFGVHYEGHWFSNTYAWDYYGIVRGLPLSQGQWGLSSEVSELSEDLGIGVREVEEILDWMEDNPDQAMEWIVETPQETLEKASPMLQVLMRHFLAGEYDEFSEVYYMHMGEVLRECILLGIFQYDGDGQDAAAFESEGVATVY